MANTKRKPEETPKRSPGKSKFVFPNREAPPVDNTYFDRLFSELQQEKPDSDALTQVSEVSILAQANRTASDEGLNDQAVLRSNESTSLPQIAEIPGAGHLDNESARFKELPEDEPLNQDLAGELSRLEIVPERIASKHLSSPVISTENKYILEAAEQVSNAYCKPETSSYVDQLKLKYRLSKGEANVFRYLLGATHDKGQGECYITIPKLAEAASLTTRGCQIALKSLQMRDFVVRAEEYDPANRLGIKIQVNLISL
jgi:hypothetical protein